VEKIRQTCEQFRAIPKQRLDRSFKYDNKKLQVLISSQKLQILLISFKSIFTGQQFNSSLIGVRELLQF